MSWSDLTDPVASTTAWGRGVDLATALRRIDARVPVPAPGAPRPVVELGPGTFPVGDPDQLLGAWSSRFRFVAHHAAPVLPGALLRPTASALDEACRRLPALGVSRYTAHPPPRRFCPDDEQLWSWAAAWFESLAAVGVEFRVETMYRPRTRSEMEVSGGYHLDDAVSVLRFATRAVDHGWGTPLLVDASHLHIGFHGGRWTSADVDELLASGLSDHLHVSANDGRADSHVQVPPGHLVESWVLPHLHRFELVVDEAGARTGPLPAPHAADAADALVPAPR